MSCYAAVRIKEELNVHSRPEATVQRAGPDII